MRVWAVNGTNVARSGPGGRTCGRRSRTRETMERPSGVSSARLESRAASARVSMRTAGAGISSVAMRLPWVMVPVLPRRSTSTSPDASTARPLIARTFLRIRRSMPAIPMAERRPPMVVGIRQTSSATSTAVGRATPE